MKFMMHDSGTPPTGSREEFLARAKALQGRPLNWFEPKAVIACVVGTVNAPCHRRLSAGELSEAIRAGSVHLSQVDSFYTEIDVDAQRIFAAELCIPEEDLQQTARALAECSGEDVPLLAT